MSGLKSHANAFCQFDAVYFGYEFGKRRPSQGTDRITPDGTVTERDSRFAIDRHDGTGSVFDERMPIIQSLLQLVFDRLRFAYVDYREPVNDITTSKRGPYRKLDRHDPAVNVEVE